MSVLHETDIQLQSAYRTVMGSEPPYTNYTGNFKGVLDYVWFSSPHIRPLAVAPVGPCLLASSACVACCLSSCVLTVFVALSLKY